MTFPSYVLTRTVSVGGAAVLESSDLLRIRLTITASKSLIHAESGYRFKNLSFQTTSEAGTDAVAVLPRTDMSGWKDARTGDIIDVTADGSYTHQYMALVEYLDADGNSKGIAPDQIGPFVVPAGTGAIDLDKLVPVGSSSGESISFPAYWDDLVQQAQASAAAAQAALIDSDVAVASFVADDTSETGQALSTKITDVVDAAIAQIEGAPSAPRSPVVGTVSDSIGAAAGSYLNAFSRLGPALAGDRLRYWHVRAVGGADLVDMHAYIDEMLAYDPKPSVILYAGGTNSANGTLQKMKDDHSVGLAKILTAGVIPILWAPPPRGAGNASANATTAAFAQYIRDLGASRGWEVLDAHTLLKDPATGEMRPEYDDAPTPNTVNDGVHPNYAAHLILARAYAAIIRRLFPVALVRPQLSSPYDSALTASMGLFLTDANADGFADGTTSVSASGTAAVVPGAPIGKWQRKTITAGSASGGSIRIETTGIIPGHVYEFAYVARANLLMADGTGGGMSSFWRDESAQIAGVDMGGGQHGATGLRGLAPEDLVWIRFTATAPAGSTRVRSDISIAGTATVNGWVDIGMLAIRDLTDLGMAR